MTFVLEPSLETDQVLFVFRVRLIQSMEYLDLFHAGFSPVRGLAWLIQIDIQSRRDFTHIVSLFRMILMATSLSVLLSVALTTLENIPLPKFA